jgi:hypothetical protein
MFFIQTLLLLSFVYVQTPSVLHGFDNKYLAVPATALTLITGTDVHGTPVLW